MTFQAATAARLASLAALVLAFPGAGIRGDRPGELPPCRCQPRLWGPGWRRRRLHLLPGGHQGCRLGCDIIRAGRHLDEPASLRSTRMALSREVAGVPANVCKSRPAASTPRRSRVHAPRGDDRSRSPAERALLQSGRVSCPPGTVAYGGGGFFSQPGGPPEGGGRRGLYASMPDADGTGWFFATAGGTFLPPGTELWIRTHCLPRAQFGQILTVTATETAPPDRPSAPGHPAVFVAARCPAGFSAYAGGALVASRRFFDARVDGKSGRVEHDRGR